MKLSEHDCPYSREFLTNVNEAVNAVDEPEFVVIIGSGEAGVVWADAHRPEYLIERLYAVIHGFEAQIARHGHYTNRLRP